MNLKTFILTALVSAVVAVAATVAVFAFWFYSAGDMKIVDPAESFESESPTPKTESTPFPDENIKAADVESVTIETVYRNFFAEGEKCRRTYNEYFGNSDGAWSANSPCRVKLTVNRDGHAEKTIEVRRHDRAARESRVVEKNVWKAKLTQAEFYRLAEVIVNNQAFKEWNDGISLYASNCEISVRHKNGTKSPMSNVDERTTAYLPMVEAFRALDAKINWERIE